MDGIDHSRRIDWQRLDRAVAKAFPKQLLVGLYRAEKRLGASLPDWRRRAKSHDLLRDDNARAVDRMEHCWHCLRDLRHELDKLHEHIEAMQSSRTDRALASVDIGSLTEDDNN